MQPNDTSAAFGAFARFAWLVVIAIPLALAVAGWRISPPILNPDTATGFAVSESGRDGAPWNCLRAPDPADLNRDRDVFVTWWSPGQYVVPGWWHGAGFSWGESMILTTLGCIWLQAAGCWMLARMVRLGHTSAAWLTMAAVLGWHGLQQFGHFRGGEALLEAAAPWLLAIAWSLRSRPWTTLIVAPALLIGALWLKLSALLLLVPILGGLAAAHAWRFRSRPAVAVAFIGGLVTIMGLSWWALDFAFFSHGPTPARALGGAAHPFGLISYALISPWLAATGVSSVVGRVCWWLGVNAETFWQTNVPVTLLGAAIAWWAGWRWWLRPLDEPLRRATVGVLVANVGLLAFLYARGSSISIEDRHVRPVATLILLGAVVAQFSSPSHRCRRYTRAALLAVIGLGVGAALQRDVALARLSSRDPAGFCQQQFPAAAQAQLALLVRSVPDRAAVVYTPSPEIGLAVTHQRRLTTDDLSRDLATVRSHRWLGHGPRLVVVVRDDMERDGRGAAVRAAFVDYRDARWQATEAGGWWFWTAAFPAT